MLAPITLKQVDDLLHAWAYFKRGDRESPPPAAPEPCVLGVQNLKNYYEDYGLDPDTPVDLTELARMKAQYYRGDREDPLEHCLWGIQYLVPPTPELQCWKESIGILPGRGIWSTSSVSDMWAIANRLNHLDEV